MRCTRAVDRRCIQVVALHAASLRARDRSRAEQFALALHAPAIAREAAVVAHDAVARRSPPRGVSCAGAGNGAHRTRRADPLARCSSRLAVAPAGISRSASQTRCWNAVPRTSSGKASPRAGRLDQTRPPAPPVARRLRRRRPAAPSGTGPRGRAPGLSGSSPSRIAATPLALEATRMAPSEHWPTAKRQHLLRAARAVVRRAHAEHAGRSLVEAAVRAEARFVERLR